MNELQAIVEAFAETRARDEQAALATIVSVVGSAYRRSGARMLITEGGRTVSTISGGCLERDVIERAAEVMDSGEARIIEYDTRGNEDIVWGLGLGCNGVVRILLESLHEESDGARTLKFIADCLRARHTGVIATIIGAAETSFKSGDKASRQRTGARLLFVDEQNTTNQNIASQLLIGDETEVEFIACLREDAGAVLNSGRSSVRAYETGAGQIEIFFDLIEPPRSLFVFGAEQDALPVVRLARSLGWHLTVVDTRARSRTSERFYEANEVVLCRAEEAASSISLAQDAAAIVMTHNYLDDIELLRCLLPSQVGYVGILGPKQRTAKLLEELSAEGVRLTNAQLTRLHSPIGMDIGAETPEEIALSIIAEVKTAFANRSGGFLRDRNAPIHDEVVAPDVAAAEPSATSHAIPREGKQQVACGLS
jgi:xanthine dehydrogenase accessory factor